jgi:hypothetical protein
MSVGGFWFGRVGASLTHPTTERDARNRIPKVNNGGMAQFNVLLHLEFVVLDFD